jgi:hypothetical protein
MQLSFRIQGTSGNTWRFASHLAVAVAAAVSCGDGRTEPDHDIPVRYQFALAAFGGDTTPERARSYDCLVYGYFEIPEPVPASGTVRFPVKVERRLFERRGNHDALTRADSSIAEGVLQYTGLGDDSLQFVLAAGPYTATLGPGELAPYPPPEYAGDWTCGPDVPLAQDSTLLAYGFDPSLEVSGTWRVSELQPTPPID